MMEPSTTSRSSMSETDDSSRSSVSDLRSQATITDTMLDVQSEDLSSSASDTSTINSIVLSEL